MKRNVSDPGVVNAAIIALSNRISDYIESDEESKKKFPEEYGRIAATFTSEVNAADKGFIITNDVLFGHIFYDELCSLLHNPWTLVSSKELGENTNIKRLAKYLVISKCNPDIFSNIDAHSIYKNDIGKITQEDADKYMKYTLDPLIDLLDIIDNTISSVKDDEEAKTEIRNTFGISIDDISSNISEIYELIEDKDFNKAKEKIIFFVNYFKQACDEWIDSAIKLSKDTLDEAAAEHHNMNRSNNKKASATEEEKKKPSTENKAEVKSNMKIDSVEAVKAVLINHGYTSVEETPGGYKDTMYLICTNSKGVARYFLVDLTGVYCNKLPKVFITTANANPLFAVHIKDFSKWLDEIDKGVEKTSINYVVSDKYLELATYGINLSSEIVLANSKKLYSLVKSPEWKTFTAVYHPASIELAIEQIENILSIKTAAGEALLSIRDGEENKCLISTETGWTNVMSRPNRPVDPFVSYANS